MFPEGHAPAVEAAARCPNLVLETCGHRMTARHLVRLVAESGPHRIAFGSDDVFLDLRRSGAGAAGRPRRAGPRADPARHHGRPAERLPPVSTPLRPFPAVVARGSPP
ncbi:amidohydrolase family protein [Streptomyces sp. NPDC096153]|uniref:amidohydrolase family protein n=1 Tax=Streptomyces sp. NPDC096153 TaxID=3155548 RepID=UPI00331A41C4